MWAASCPKSRSSVKRHRWVTFFAKLIAHRSSDQAAVAVLDLFKRWSRRVCASCGLLALLFPPSLAANPIDTFDVLSYNIYMRPFFLDGQRVRAEYLVAQLAGYDAIVFQEAYDDRIRDLLLEGLAQEYPFRTRILGHDAGFEQDGGVIIISRWPIVREAQRVFTADRSSTNRCPGPDCCEDSDCYADKGVVYARINKAGRCYHLFGTHVQAGTENWKLRNEQFKVISDFVASRRVARGAPVIIAGDLNVDRRDRARFADMQDLLAAVQPPLQPTAPRTRGGIYTFDGLRNDLNDHEDVRRYVDYALYSIEHLMPISAYNQVRIIRAPEAWRYFFWQNGQRDLSDHYAVLGHFVYARGANRVRVCR
jgi:endonuclease/exonuclease/phosphatase family metal-dependent hydrolase